MSVEQNAIELAHKYPLASKVVEESFYVDDCITGADSEEDGIQLQAQLQDLFAEADFLLRKWNSSNPTVLQAISPDTQTSLTLSESDEVYSKTLGIAWHSVLDHFRLSVADHPPLENLTKRKLVSEIAKTYDVLGWFAPSIIMVKILLQRVWESKVDWDDPVPLPIEEEWISWRSQLGSLRQVHIPRCYFPKQAQIVTFQLHGFSDASENAYAAVVYFRMTDCDGAVYTSLIASNTKVAPIKRLTILRLELCGAHLLLEHVQTTLKIPIEQVFAWTDSTIVIHWLDGNPRRFKTYVGNRVSFIVDHIPPSRWNHVSGEQNPADCASRGLELIEHKLWWNGPEWLKPQLWPKSHILPHDQPADEERRLCLLTSIVPQDPVIALDRFSSFTRLVRITAWIMKFVKACRSSRENRHSSLTVPLSLTVAELTSAENYWISHSQQDCFGTEIDALKLDRALSSGSKLLTLHLFIDSNGIIRVGGRQQNASLKYSAMHPIVLQGNHSVTRLLVRKEHERLLHAGATLFASSLNRQFYIIGCRKIVRTITRGCSVCRRHAEKPRPQMMGQLPIERVSPDIVFGHVGIDYAGPLYIKQGHVRKPTMVKAYVCVFVSMSVKAIHLELVSDLTTDAFIAALRRFISRRGKPSLIQSDHGTNFVGAKKELNELATFLQDQKTQALVSQFCTSQRIQWKFIPERSPHFGDIWEAAVKSFKFHLKRVTANVKMTFEECCTILTQIEACLNS